jgi:hypothetical protein
VPKFQRTLRLFPPKPALTEVRACTTGENHGEGKNRLDSPQSFDARGAHNSKHSALDDRAFCAFATANVRNNRIMFTRMRTMSPRTPLLASREGTSTVIAQFLARFAKAKSMITHPKSSRGGQRSLDRGEFELRLVDPKSANP